jgi:hypothetical protein
MCDLSQECGATRAYPDKPIDFRLFEYYVRSIPGVDLWSLADAQTGDRVLALCDEETGHVELIAVPLDSGNVGFHIRPSPALRLQQLICRRFGVELICDEHNRHVQFISAETANWQPHVASASAY